MTDGIQAWIDETVRANPVVLFMKGSRQFPRLGSMLNETTNARLLPRGNGSQ